jgi:hypothetical protein
MPANKIFRRGPLFLTTTTTTNILNPGTTTGGVGTTASPYGNLYVVLRKIRVTNRTTSSAKFALWLGATGANVDGTEFLWSGLASAGALTQGVTIGPNSFVEEFGLWRFDVADFLVGGADTASALTFEAAGEIGIA